MFVAEGIEAIVVEANADEADACKVAVASPNIVQANAIVTAVTSGRRTLPGARLSWQSIVALLAILGLFGWMFAR